MRQVSAVPGEVPRENFCGSGSSTTGAARGRPYAAARSLGERSEASSSLDESKTEASARRLRSRVLGLVEADFASARQSDSGNRAPARFRHLRALDAPGVESLQLGG